MNLAHAGKRLANQTLALQFTFIVVVAVIWSQIYDLSSAISVVTGGTVSVLSNALFAYYVFRFSGASKIQQTVNSMKKGNMFKLFVTLLAFGLIYQMPFLHNLDAVIGYCIALLAHYLILITLHRVAQQRDAARKDF